MSIKEGTEAAVLVDGKWLAALRKAVVLPEESDEPFQLMFGKIASCTENIGLWLTPGKPFSDPAGIVQLFIPWHFVVTVAVVQDKERRRLGFGSAARA